MYKLSKPQQTVAGCSIVVAIIFFGLLVYLGLQEIRNDNPSTTTQADTQQPSTQTQPPTEPEPEPTPAPSPPTDTETEQTTPETSATQDTETPTEPEPPAETPQASPDQLTLAITEQINNYRANNVIQPLTLETTLTNIAREYSKYLVEQGEIVKIDDDGNTFRERCATASISCEAELIAYTDITTAEAVFTQWQTNPTSAAHMLDDDYKFIGLGHAGGYTVVLLR